MASRIVSTQKEFVTPWFELISKRVKGSPDPYYSLRMQDYVAVVAFTEQNELILIRQYRPAVECCTLELPCGHVEENEAPAESAQRELAEESGFHATQLELLGTLLSDTGRHENRLWCYYAKSATPGQHRLYTGIGVGTFVRPTIGASTIDGKWRIRSCLTLGRIHASRSPAWA